MHLNSLKDYNGLLFDNISGYISWLDLFHNGHKLLTQGIQNIHTIIAQIVCLYVCLFKCAKFVTYLIIAAPMDTVLDTS